MTRPLRIAFLGSDSFSLPTLTALLEAGHDVAAVYSQPPRPAGRGRKLQLSPVHAYAASRGIPVRTPSTLRNADAQQQFAALDLDAGVVAAYGLILPKPILDAPRLGCINVHASLLPRWRGAAPVERAILEGDATTGVTIMQMAEGLDTGPVLLARSVPISGSCTAASLRATLAALGGELLVDALQGVAGGLLRPTPQPADGVTYAKKLEPGEGRLDWSRPAAELDRKVRALNPQPGVWFEHAGERIKVLDAEPVPSGGTPGEVLDEQLTVACGTGALRLLLLQRPGRSAMDAAAFLRGYRIATGTMLR